VRLRHAGARDRRRLERGRCGIEDFLPEQCGAEAEMRRSQAGVKGQRLPETAGGFAEPARAQIGVAESAMITGDLWSHRDDAAQQFDGALMILSAKRKIFSIIYIMRYNGVGARSKCHPSAS
jgi:hypothetical protein